MKLIGIIGYKNSGKTELGVRLAKTLKDMGYKVAAIKHAPHEIELPETDTARYLEHAAFTAAVSDQRTEIVLNGGKFIEELLPFIDADIVIVEGFKNGKTYPRILCLAHEEDRLPLITGLEIAVAGFEGSGADYRIDNDKDIEAMAKRVIEKSFKLPALNCTHCGYEECYIMAKAIIGGEKNVMDCVAINTPVSVKIDGVSMALNPFTTKVVRNAIWGIISSLKGAKKGDIEIKIPKEGILE